MDNALPAKTHLRIQRKARSMAITSGKGGVGKSSITVNLAISLAKQGRKVCIFDADTGLANINIMLNISPDYTIEHVIRGEKQISDILLPAAHDIRVIPGASGISECANLSTEQQVKLFDALSKLESHFDYILIDTAAGIAQSVLHFIRASHLAVVVVTPEPTSLTDAFSLIKVLKRQGHTQPIQVIINRCRDADQARKVFQRLTRASRKYLELDLKYLSFLPEDDSMKAAVSLQHPVALYPNSDPTSRCFSRLAESVERQWPGQENKLSFSEYWEQLGSEKPTRHLAKQNDVKLDNSDSNPVPTSKTSNSKEEKQPQRSRLPSAADIAPFDSQQYSQSQLEALIKQLTEDYIARFHQLPISPKMLLERTMTVTQGQHRGEWHDLGDKLHQVLQRQHTPAENKQESEATSAETSAITTAESGNPSQKAALIIRQHDDSANAYINNINRVNGDCYDDVRFGSQDTLLQNLQSRNPTLSVEQFLSSLLLQK